MSRVRRRRIHAVILAGGAGTRFWPLSRESRPKPLLRVGDRRTLLESTLVRARRFAPPERIWMVCAKEHARAMRAGSGLPSRRVLVEPRGRNTALAVGAVAQRLAQDDPEAVLAVLPSDHKIPDARAFAAAIRRAADAAAGEDVLVTLGVKPTRPETGYGYIRVGGRASAAYPGLRRVARFVEKPDRARARRYLRDGGYLWNAGVFVWTARVILEEIASHAPAVHRTLSPLRRAGKGRRAWAEAMQAAYRRAPSVPIDTAVLESSRRVWCLPADFRWSDVGTWQSLADELGVGPNVTRIIDGEVLLYDASGNLVRASERPIVLLGVRGLAVIDSGDAVLVSSLERSPEVREVVSQLRRRGRSDLI
jgi:mannose-1-phosphate guanylyltransferase